MSHDWSIWVAQVIDNISLAGQVARDRNGFKRVKRINTEPGSAERRKRAAEKRHTRHRAGESGTQPMDTLGDKKSG